ncbi:hypothetical protein, partial [Roseibium polysiphoniae]|uniref:hypothetical protein n=1 Tax=Roseibium polysiphoniae TaxID=2571221 RepID=UPI001AD8C2D5
MMMSLSFSKRNKGPRSPIFNPMVFGNDYQVISKSTPSPQRKKTPVGFPIGGFLLIWLRGQDLPSLMGPGHVKIRDRA